MSETLAGLVHQARELLRFQGELGLSGLDVPAELLTARPEPVAEPDASVEPTPVRPVPAANREAALHQIRTTLTDCTRCKLAKRRTNIVYGVGNANARLMFIGEGPGRDEDLQGEPFVGAAGQLLDKMIKAMTLRRADVYIANIVKCRPPRNRDPEQDEVAECEPFLKQQIAVIQPEVLVALGRCAAQTLLRDATSITRMRGKWHPIDAHVSPGLSVAQRRRQKTGVD